MPIPAACQPIKDKMEAALQKGKLLQEQLQHAGPHDRPAILAQIKALNHQLALLKMELTECIGVHHTEPHQAIEGYFIGTSNLPPQTRMPRVRTTTTSASGCLLPQTKRS